MNVRLLKRALPLYKTWIFYGRMEGYMQDEEYKYREIVIKLKGFEAFFGSLLRVSGVQNYECYRQE